MLAADGAGKDGGNRASKVHRQRDVVQDACAVAAIHPSAKCTAGLDASRYRAAD